MEGEPVRDRRRLLIGGRPRACESCSPPSSDDGMAERLRLEAATLPTPVRIRLSSPTRPRRRQRRAGLPGRTARGADPRGRSFDARVAERLGGCLPSSPRRVQLLSRAQLPEVADPSRLLHAAAAGVTGRAATEHVPTKCRRRHGCFVSSRAGSESPRGLCRVEKRRPLEGRNSPGS